MAVVCYGCRVEISGISYEGWLMCCGRVASDYSKPNGMNIHVSQLVVAW